MSIFKRNNEVSALREQVAVLQHMVGDITVAGAQLVAYPGNPYPSYKAQVVELGKKYAGCSQWGCSTVKNLVDVRAAFVISNGVTPALRTEGVGEKELEYIQEFMRRNNLDKEVPREWAKEAEIEGKALLHITPNEKDQQVDVRFVSYSQHQYTVTANERDYSQYDKVEYRVNQSGLPVTLAPEEFVYKKFGGRVSDVNDSPPKCGAVLWDVESMARAMYDWRKMNGFFASPTPYFKVNREDEVTGLSARLKQIGWKIGKFLVSTADFSLVGMPTSGVDSVQKEVTTHAQVISGATGVPVHFLGFPELMSNRSTADSTMEYVQASTSKERTLWAGGYEELFYKVLQMANTRYNMGFDPWAIVAVLAEASSARLAELATVWLPIYKAGALSLETLLSKIPDVDVEKELDNLKRAEEEAAQRTLAQMKLQEPKFDDGE